MELCRRKILRKLINVHLTFKKIRAKYVGLGGRRCVPNFRVARRLSHFQGNFRGTYRPQAIGCSSSAFYEPIGCKLAVQMSMGWSEEEEPVFVLEDGTVLIYSMFGLFKSSFSMGQEAKDIKILGAR
jgi:hypothetical protein